MWWRKRRRRIRRKRVSEEEAEGEEEEKEEDCRNETISGQFTKKIKIRRMKNRTEPKRDEGKD